MGFKMGNPKPKVPQDQNLTVLNASYSGVSFSVVDEDAAPQSVSFNSTGTRMFIVGTSTNSVYQYNLGTGFDVSTANYSGISLDVSSQDGRPTGGAWNPNGTRLFVVGMNDDKVYQYNFSSGFDLSTASFSGDSFDVSGQFFNPRGIAFNPAGTRMFIIGRMTNAVFQYNLGTSFDITTASYSGTSFDVSGQATVSSGVTFNSTGTRMFTTGFGSDAVHEYHLTTGFDVSTATYSGNSFDVSTQAVVPQGVTFNPNGTLMFVVGSNSNEVYQYNVS